MDKNKGSFVKKLKINIPTVRPYHAKSTHEIEPGHHIFVLNGKPG